MGAWDIDAAHAIYNSGVYVCCTIQRPSFRGCVCFPNLRVLYCAPVFRGLRLFPKWLCWRSNAACALPDWRTGKATQLKQGVIKKSACAVLSNARLLVRTTWFPSALLT